MSIEDLPPAGRALIRSMSGPRYENIGVYHVTETIYCLTKAQLLRLFMDDSRFISTFGNGSWAPFRGQVFHKFFSDAIGFIYQMTEEWEYKGEALMIKGENDWMEERDGQWILGELKTVKNRWWYEKNGAGDEHKKQAAAYIYMLRKAGFPNLKTVRFYYADMEDIIPVEVTFNKYFLKDNMKELKDRAEVLHDALRGRYLIEEACDWRKSWEANPKYNSFTAFTHPDYPFEPPEGKEYLTEWFAGPGKMKARAIDIQALIPPAIVWEVLDHAEVTADWRER
ncbi:MAG: hypothetical protein V3W37_08170 [Candidatus Binatia bacterium]